MTSKIVVNNIESDAGISSVTLVSNIAGEDSTQNISGINSVTATTFHGSLDSSNLTGTVADARISSLTASKLSGALPAISGANLTSLPAQATNFLIQMLI